MGVGCVGVLALIPPFLKVVGPGDWLPGGAPFCFSSPSSDLLSPPFPLSSLHYSDSEAVPPSLPG